MDTIFYFYKMGRPRKSSRRGCKRGRKCKGIRRKTYAAYVIPNEYACAGMRGPATTVITTNGMYPRQSMGWSKQQIDDQQSSGLGYGPRPFRTSY